ncbi:MAG: site-specific integrase [Alphaproteobacteria bacterium]|nr:site-specific integrase [Alphaproteobacteria bacterium]
MPKPKRLVNPSRILSHPSPSYAERIRLHQYRRGASDAVWEATYRLAGVWTRHHRLGTTDWTDAVVKSVVEYNRREIGGNAPTKTKKLTNAFAEAAKIAIEELNKKRTQITKTEGSRAAGLYANPINYIKKLAEFFGSMPVNEIKLKNISEWRKKFPNEPATNTLGNYNHAFGMVMKEAISLGWIEDGEQITISRKGGKPSIRRETFNSADMKKLAEFMSPKWIGDSEIRRLIRAYIAVGATTGIRAGREMERLHVGQVLFHKKYQSIVVLNQKIKNGKRREVAVYQNDAFDMRKILLDLTNGRAPTDKLFANSKGKVIHFGREVVRIFITAGVRVDPISQMERTAYSLRHYYATQSLMRGVAIDEVAREMGTSTAMIEQNYSHVIAQNRHAQLSGSKNEMARLRAAISRQHPEVDLPNDDDDDPTNP